MGGVTDGLEGMGYTGGKSSFVSFPRNCFIAERLASSSLFAFTTLLPHALHFSLSSRNGFQQASSSHTRFTNQAFHCIGVRSVGIGISFGAMFFCAFASMTWHTTEKYEVFSVLRYHFSIHDSNIMSRCSFKFSPSSITAFFSDHDMISCFTTLLSRLQLRLTQKLSLRYCYGRRTGWAGGFGHFSHRWTAAVSSVHTQY
jgi:hypothetical protein